MRKILHVTTQNNQEPTAREVFIQEKSRYQEKGTEKYGKEKDLTTIS